MELVERVEQVIAEYGVKGRSGRHGAGFTYNKLPKMKKVTRGKLKGTMKMKNKAGKTIYVKF